MKSCPVYCNAQCKLKESAREDDESTIIIDLLSLADKVNDVAIGESNQQR